MSSPADFHLAFSKTSSPKLPAIGENRNLVSQTYSRELNEPRDVTDKDRPVLLRENSKGEATNNDVAKLINLVSRAFIAALQRNNEVLYWAHLCEVLESSKPYASLLKVQQLSHYVERAYIEIQGREVELGKVLECLRTVFPEVISKLLKTVEGFEKKQKFPSEPIGDIPLSPQTKHPPIPRGVKVPRGEPVIPLGSMYALEKASQDMDIKPYQPKKLILGDITKSLADVVQDISVRESALGVPLGITIMALNVDLPRNRVPTPPETPKRSMSIPLIKGLADNRSKSVQGESESKKEKSPRTGREVIEDFVKGRFLGELKFAYLNMAPSRHYDPYNLIEVPKDKVNPEHFVISSHSILHVTPKGPTESQSLSEWYTEACVFQAISNLYFFKNFLLLKAFLRWKDIKRFSYFLKTGAEIEKSLIHNVPSFGSALLRISYLLHDLSKITFLPFDASYCYTLHVFEDLTFKTSDTARTYLQKFFNYCQMIVDKSQENCFEYLRYCEAQVKNHRHNYRESLAVAKEKRGIRHRNLGLAREEVSKLGTFVRLVDHIIVQHLLTLAQTNICKFVDYTLPGPRPEREGLFAAIIAFDENHKLTLVPSTKQLSYSLTSALEKVLTFICSLTHAMQLGMEAQSFQVDQKDGGGPGLENSTNPQNDTVYQEPASPRHLHFSPSVLDGDQTGIEITGDTIGINLTNQDSTGCLAGPGETEAKQEPCVSTVYQDTRTDAEIQEDLDNFNTGLASAREMRQTTAEELCFRQTQESSLIVEGQKIEQYGINCSPLTREKLEDTLYHDEKIIAALNFQEEFANEAIMEVNEFCESHSWLAEIHAFVSMWDDSQMEYWRGQPTIKIEQQLNQIRSWSDQVFNVIKGFSTANGLLHVDCHIIQNAIVPKLDNIFKQMVMMVTSHVLVLSEEVIQEVEQLSESLKEQKVDISGFADFIQQLGKVTLRVSALKEKVEYIKNSYEVIRSCYRQLSPQEEITEEKVWAMWEAFLFGLQEASDFVQQQKPQVVDKIAEAVMELEEEAEDIGDEATSGPYLDPDEYPSTILTCMRQLRERYQWIRSKLTEISQCKEVITGSSYDMTRIMVIYKALEKRQELWRYCEMSSYTIRDWLHSPFKKMNVKRAIEKVNEWITVGNSLKEHLPVNDDVLTSWLCQLEEFVQDLPLLLQLSSDALKPRHWRALFIGIGQEFDSSMLFTSAALLCFNLGRYKDLIAAVCAGAGKEHALELQLQQLTKAWREKDFKLAKHMPLLRPRFGGKGQGRRDDQKKKKKKRTKLTVGEKKKPKTPSSVPDLFILIGIGELKCMIEDNLVTLQSMLVSPYVADLKPSVEKWITSLHELEDILDIWVDSQKKWLYLNNVFSEPKIVQDLPQYKSKLSMVDMKYREFIEVILKDPKVLSVLGKKRWEKEWRELQGEGLRYLLTDLVRSEEELIQVVEAYIHQARVAFPRLYFLSDDALLSLLAWSRNPNDLLPFVRMCFPAIRSLSFTLPLDSSLKLSTALDAALNAHLLQVTAMEGDLDEVVTLAFPIPASPQPQKWLATLEENMRNTLVGQLSECVKERLAGVASVAEFLDKLVNPGTQTSAKRRTKHSSPRNSDRDPALSHWLLRYPAQCVQTADAVVWARDVSQVLLSGRLIGLSRVRSTLGTYIDDLSSAIRKNTEWQGDNSVYKRVDRVLAALLTQAVHHRDVVNTLIDDRVSSVHSFEWQSEVRQEMDIAEVITPLLSGSKQESRSTFPNTPSGKSYYLGQCTAQHIGTSSAYGYEYLGPSSRLVVTPLTKRCFLTLTMALQSYKCGTPLGPDGTGKTETIRDLSKMLGRHLVVFDCTNTLASPMFVRYLTGMIRSGSWVCFENADIVKPGVLSTFAHHLEKIRLSLKAVTRTLYNQYSIRGMAKTDKTPNGPLTRRSSVTSLVPLYGDTNCWSQLDENQKSKKRRRRFSLTEATDIPASKYYDASENSLSFSDSVSQDTEAFTRPKEARAMKFTMPILGNVVFNSELMAASGMYGCFLTMSTKYSADTNIPENMKALMRPVAMLVPDSLPVLEVWMTCCGFTEAKSLAKKICTFFKLVSDQVSDQPRYDFGLRAMRSVINLATVQLKKELKKRPATMESLQEEDVGTRSPFMESFERRQNEENSVVHGLFNHYGNKLLAADKEVFSQTVDAVFIHSILLSVVSEGEPILAEVIKEHLQSNGLQVKPEIIAKALQLYKGIQSNRNVILLGSAGAGKTILCQALVGAINSLHTQLSPHAPKGRRTLEKKSNAISQSPRSAKTEYKDITWPQVDMRVVFPKTFTQEELFGQRDVETKLWHDGMISKYFRDSTLTCNTMNELLLSQTDEKHRVLRGMGGASRVEKWLVFDGPMDNVWLENISTVLDQTRALCLGNGESIAMPDTLSMLFETTDLSGTSPSIVTRCSLVHCPENMIGWKAVFRSWIKTAHAKWDISNRGLGIISCLMDHMVDKTLDFLQQHCHTILTADYGVKSTLPLPSRGIHEVQSLIRYLSAIFDRHILRDDDDRQVQFINQKGRASVAGSVSSRTSSGITASDTGKVISTIAFAFIWAFGGHLHDRYTKAFDEHARQLLASGPYPAFVPAEGLVYDYYLDFNRGTLVKWEEMPGAQVKTLASSYTIVPEFDRYLFLLDLMISDDQPVLLVGQPGTGKSALIQNLVSPRYSYTRIFMSAGLTSMLFQEAIAAKLAQMRRREHNQLAAQHNVAESHHVPAVKSQLFFLDDLSYAGADETGVQPSLELLRQILAQGSMYNKEHHHSIPVKHVRFMATAVPPASTSASGGVASYPMSARLTRLMTVLSFFPVSPGTLKVIYSGVLQSWLEEFPAYSLTHHSVLAKAMAGAAVEVYNKVREELRPSPLHPHFLFTQHELARIAQGMSLFSTRSRARPRPRLRRRVGDGKESMSTKDNEVDKLDASKSLDDVTVKEKGKRSREPKKGRSWPTLPESTATNDKTPAAISPLIRSLVRLWSHENTRVYGDRLLDEGQRYWFASLLHEQVEEHFCKGSEDFEPIVFDKPPEFEQILADIAQGPLGVAPGTTAPPPTAERVGTPTGSLPEEPSEAAQFVEDAVVVPTGQLAADALIEDPAEYESESGEDEVTNVVENEEANVEDEALDETESLLELGKDTDSAQLSSTKNDSAESTFVSQLPRSKVTFDDIKQNDNKNYQGPLITTDQLALPGEDLTDIVFCKHFNVSASGRNSTIDSATRGYMECSDGILEQGVERAVESYNRQASEMSSFKTVNLVAFREALRHAARISRALAIPGGHALLLSSLGYGRRTLTRLAVHAAGFKLMEAQATHFQSRDELRQQIKAASCVAGVQGNPVVLFVPEGVQDSSLQDICTLVAEGTCPGLYTANELAIISSQLLPGGQRGARRMEHQDIAQERFFRRVKSNLHVVVCLKYIPLSTAKGPLQAQLYKFSGLVTRCCCVDVYQPWPHEALVNVAEKLVDEEDPAFRLVPWNRRERESQVAAICSIMAHVHLSSRSMVERLYGNQGLKLYSPNSFLDFVDLFKKLCERICTHEKATMSRLQDGIKRMDEANRSLDKMQDELDQLTPVFEHAQNEVKQCQQSVESSQKEYLDQKEACKKQELEIEKMQGPIEQLKQEAKEEFGKVSPLFEAAWDAINALDIHDVEEIRSYRLPPSLVELVANSVCLLFEKPQTWEDGKLLLNRDNFFKDLEFYDMKNMPDRIFNKLESFYNNPAFTPDIVKSGSVAAASLCMWVRAVYDYCVVYRVLAPKQNQLKNAQAELEKAKSVLGEMRVRCNSIKQELEEKIQSYKDSVKHAKNIEKQMQGTESRKERGTKLVNSMSTYSQSWQQNLGVWKQNLVKAPGDALVTAASVCYFGPLIQLARQELFADWLRVCDGVSRELPNTSRSLTSVMFQDTDISKLRLQKREKNSWSESRPFTQESTVHSTLASNNMPVREGTSLKLVLSSSDELADWVRCDLPNDEFAIQNALIMRTCSNDRKRCWPLLIDPHEQAEDWVRVWQQAQSKTMESPSHETQDTAHVLESASERSLASRASTSLDDEYLALHHEAYMEDKEDKDSLLLGLKDGDDEQDTRYGDSDSPMTARTDQTGGSAFTTMTERVFREKLHQEMGIQIDSPERSSIFGPTPSLDVDEGQLMVISADDSQIVGRIRAAVQTGVVVLVTHMERYRWNKNLELLLARQTFTGSSGTTQVVIGKSAVHYHPSFRLFLSASMPLFMPGKGLVPLPFAKTCVIDMSLSQEGLTNRLLIETLALERPELDGQERSLKRDLTLHEQQIVNAKEFVLEKVLGLSCPLLKDSTMLGAVQKSEDVISTAEERHEESQAMRKQLHEKRDDFFPVAQHGAMLYAIICHMHRVRPNEYYMPLDAFLGLFQQTIADRRRNKKNMGSAAARAAELITALSRKVYARASWNFFLGDNHMFSFLICVEQQLSNDQITEQEWHLFVYLTNPSPSLYASRNVSEKPAWVTAKAWQSIDDLELFHAFSALRQSLTEYPLQWKEYFLLPPVLLSSTPGDFGHLTMLQKAMLWNIFREDQMFQVCQDLVLYVMGAAMVQPLGYDLHEVYRVSNNATPVVFILPAPKDLATGAAMTITDPANDVLNLASAHGKATQIMTVSFGEDTGMEDALFAVQHGMEKGYWVVLKNPHLVTNWPAEFMATLHVITSTHQVQKGDEDTDSSKGTDSKTTVSKSKLEVHPEFRLWIITRADENSALPAILIQRGIKLACEAKTNFRETVMGACEVEADSLVSWTSSWGQQVKRNSPIKSDVPLTAVYALALLHSMLYERRKHGSTAFTCPYQWSSCDLRAGVDVLRHLSKACQATTESQPLTSRALVQLLAAAVYNGHVTDRMDQAVVESVAWTACAPDAIKNLAGVTQEEEEAVDCYLQHLPEHLSMHQLGLTEDAATDTRLHLSRRLGIALQQSAQLTPTPSSLEGVTNKIRETIVIISDCMASINPPDSPRLESCVAAFLIRELQFFNQLLHDVSDDLDLLNRAIEGRVALTPYLYDLAVSIQSGLVPLHWLNRCSGESSLGAWLLGMGDRVRAVQRYTSPPPPSSFSLASFAHQQAFLSCVLMDFAKANSKPLQSLVFDIEVMTEEFLPRIPPEKGIYVTGLDIQNASWDVERKCLTELSGVQFTSHLPVVLLMPVTSDDLLAKKKAAKDLDLYDCPLLARNEQTTGSRASVLVSTLPMLTSVNTNILRQRKVALFALQIS